MTTTTSHTPAPRTTSPLTQWRALVGAETKLLSRNLTQVFYALVFPLIFPVIYLKMLNPESMPEATRHQFAIAALSFSVVAACVMASYYTAVSALVNRREEAVLQRLRAGEVRESTIITAIVTPGSVMAALVSLVILLGFTKLLNLEFHPSLWLAGLGILLGVLICIAFAFVTANMTRTVEAAQVTATPFMLVALIGAGACLVPQGDSQSLYWFMNALPTGPISQLVSQGFASSIDWALVARSTGIALAWIIVIGAYGYHRLRWAKR